MPTLTTSTARALRPHLIHTVLLVGLLAACTYGPGATPSPTGSPGPTATPSPVPSPTFGPDDITHPTGATEVILRMEQGGGFMPIDFFVTQAPQFTLYGDGTVVFRPIEDVGRVAAEQGMPRFLTGKMTELGIQALLLFALDTGRLANARDFYSQNMCADCGMTIFVLDAAGISKTITVDALSELTEPGPDAVDRQGFAQLADLLRNFEQHAQEATIDEISLYDPELYRVTLLDGFGQPALEPIAWPWDDLTPDDFPMAEEPGNRNKIMTREQVALLTEVPSGGQVSIWVLAPDGTVASFGVRPLLPDEQALL